MLSFVVSGFVVLLFSSLSLNIFDSYMFQKSFLKGHQHADTLKLQISNHLQKTFAPSIHVVQNFIQWKQYFLPYPVVLESTTDATEFTLKQPLPISNTAKIEAYCAENTFYSPVVYVNGNQPSLKFSAEPPSCQLAYLIGAHSYQLSYDVFAKTLNIASLSIQYGFSVEKFDAYN